MEKHKEDMANFIEKWKKNVNTTIGNWEMSEIDNCVIASVGVSMITDDDDVPIFY